MSQQEDPSPGRHWMCVRATVVQIHDEDGKCCGERDHGHGGHIVLSCGTESVVNPKRKMKTIELPGCLIMNRKKDSIRPSDPMRGRIR